MRCTCNVTIAALIMAIPCLAGAQSARPGRDANAQQTPSDMPALIKALSGHWSLKLVFEPSQETPRGLEGSGDESWHASPGGLTFTDEEAFTAGPHRISRPGGRPIPEGHDRSRDPHTGQLAGASTLIL